jgi:glucose-6-phosphate-specific signal transduction histidine kinase
MYEEKYRPFVVTAITGCILWSISGGLIHAYLVCPDWERLGESVIQELVRGRPFLSLVCMGLLYGFAIEAAKFCGAVLRSEVGVMLAPIVVGTIIGGFQGSLVPSGIWGFSDSVIFRTENTRIISGAICGFILALPTIMIGIGIRKRGQPW